MGMKSVSSTTPISVKKASRGKIRDNLESWGLSEPDFGDTDSIASTMIAIHGFQHYPDYDSVMAGLLNEWKH